VADSSPGPVFVVGMWRSGTSLLYALLNQHPQIALMYEGDLPVLWPMFLGGRSRPDWLSRWDFWNGALQRHKLEINHFPGTVPNLSSAMETVYRGYAGLAIWGCKSPNYYDSMERIAQMFPNARFIIIWRSLDDICRSTARAAGQRSWFSRKGMAHRIVLGCRRMKLECERLASMGAPVHELHYEELVSDPAKAMARICRFLQIPFAPSMSSLRDADRSAIFDDGHHTMVKSAEIVSSQQRPEVLPPRLKAKIARYVNLWRDEYAGRWPVYYNVEDGYCRKPCLMERCSDRLIYNLLRAYDTMVVFIYCFAPLSLLRTYRSLKMRTVVPPEPAIQTASKSETVSPLP
jgi:Sulfotransferase family